MSWEPQPLGKLCWGRLCSAASQRSAEPQPVDLAVRMSTVPGQRPSAVDPGSFLALILPNVGRTAELNGLWATNQATSFILPLVEPVLTTCYYQLGGEYYNGGTCCIATRSGKQISKQ